MRPRAVMGDVRAAFAGAEDQLRVISTGAMGEATEGLKGDLRQQVESAGLGSRLAKTWRSKVYPSGRPSLDPAGFVWTKAPKIVDAFNRGATILPTDGRRYIAIPTDKVPMKGRGRRMTPLDVEVAFNQDLIIRRGRGGRILAFVDVAFARHSAAQGKAYGSRGRQAGYRRRPKPKLVLMFTLMRSAKLGKRLDIEPLGQKWAAQIPDLISTRWNAS